jgi:lipopolysaccharide export system protein LptC
MNRYKLQTTTASSRTRWVIEQIVIIVLIIGCVVGVLAALEQNTGQVGAEAAKFANKAAFYIVRGAIH